jgi:DNA mismatch repair ATPase MutL
MNSVFHFEFYLKNNYFHIISVPIIFDKLHNETVYIEMFSLILKNIDKIIVNNDDKLNVNIRNKFILLEIFMKVIKSKACREAVKFNEELENRFILALIATLRRCSNPFLCAHGRHNFFILSDRTKL